jgi:hypothetical protein
VQVPRPQKPAHDRCHALSLEALSTLRGHNRSAVEPWASNFLTGAQSRTKISKAITREPLPPEPQSPPPHCCRVPSPPRPSPERQCPPSLRVLRRIAIPPRDLRGHHRSAVGPRASKSFTMRSRFPRSPRSSLKRHHALRLKSPDQEPRRGPSPEVLHQSTEAPPDLQGHHRYADASRASTSSRRTRGAVTKSPSPPPEVQALTGVPSRPELRSRHRNAVTGTLSPPESTSPSPERRRVARRQRPPMDRRRKPSHQAPSRPKTSEARRHTLSFKVLQERALTTSVAVSQYLPRPSIGTPSPHEAPRSGPGRHRTPGLERPP